MPFTNVKILWNYLGSFWDNFEDKAFIETLWEGYAEVVGELTKRLYAVDLSKSLKFLPSLLDEVGESYPIIFSGGNQNTHIISGLHNYYVTDGTLSIPTLSGISDDPIYSGVYSGQTLTEGVDYTIIDKQRIQFTNFSGLALDPSFNDPTAVYYASHTYKVNPALRKFYLPAVGLTSDVMCDDYGHYQGTASGLNELRYKYDHLKYLSWALWDTVRNPPTMSNITRGASLARGLPFAHTSGIATVTSSYGENLVTIDNKTYHIPSGLTLAVSTNETVDQFQILISGVSAYDYISGPSYIEAQTNWDPLTYRSKIVIIISGLDSITYNTTFFEDYLNKLIPESIEYLVS